jgi:phosphomannomutase
MLADAHALIGRLLAASTRQDDFCASLAKEIIAGRDPREFSPRCKSIVIDILAKAFGRRNSKAYNEAADELGDLLSA